MGGLEGAAVPGRVVRLGRLLVVDGGPGGHGERLSVVAEVVRLVVNEADEAMLPRPARS